MQLYNSNWVKSYASLKIMQISIIIGPVHIIVSQRR